MGNKILSLFRRTENKTVSRPNSECSHLPPSASSTNYVSPRSSRRIHAAAQGAYVTNDHAAHHSKRFPQIHCNAPGLSACSSPPAAGSQGYTGGYECHDQARAYDRGSSKPLMVNQSHERQALASDRNGADSCGSGEQVSQGEHESDGLSGGVPTMKALYGLAYESGVHAQSRRQSVARSRGDIAGRPSSSEPAYASRTCSSVDEHDSEYSDSRQAEFEPPMNRSGVTSNIPTQPDNACEAEGGLVNTYQFYRYAPAQTHQHRASCAVLAVSHDTRADEQRVGRFNGSSRRRSHAFGGGHDDMSRKILGDMGEIYEGRGELLPNDLCQ